MEETHSFGRNDLLLLAKVADLAHTRIWALRQDEPAAAQAVLETAMETEA